MVKLPEPPRSIVSPNMFILTGEVIGYSEPIVDPGNFRGAAIGLKIKPLEIIHFPHFKVDYVEVFMFGHGTDCFPESRSDRYIPPIGTRYRMALMPATLVASRSGSIVRLQSRMWDIIDPDKGFFGFSTDSSFEFDYKNELPPLLEKFRKPEMMETRGWLSDFLYIEASKDLLRLARARTEDQRLKVLERLLYCPNINYRRLFLSEVGSPLQLEEREALLQSMSPRVLNKPRPKKYSKEEIELMNERTRLEASGRLKIW